MRSHKKLDVFTGSLSELETQLTIAKGLGFLVEDGDLFRHIERVFGLLGGLIRPVQKREPSQRRI